MISQSTYKVIPRVCPHGGDGFLADGARYTNTTPRCCGRFLCNLLFQLGKHVCPLSVSFWVQFTVSGEGLHKMHGVYGSLFWWPKQCRVLIQYHSKQACTGNSILLQLEKKKRQLSKCQDWQQWLLVCNSHMSHCCNEPNNKIKIFLASIIIIKYRLFFFGILMTDKC